MSFCAVNQWRVRHMGGAGVIVEFTCPECHQVSTLASVGLPGVHSHAIDGAGLVSPSVVCPFDGCSYHKWVRLEGWIGATFKRHPG